MRRIDIQTDKESAEHKVPCPLYASDVLVATACKNCRFFNDIEDDQVLCEYESPSDKFEKSASSYPADGVRGGKTTDFTTTERKSLIARDSVNRDLHEPSMEDLADYFGFTMDEVITGQLAPK